MPARRTETVYEAVETEVAFLLRWAEATRRAMPGQALRALDRAAYIILRQLDRHGDTNVGALATLLGLDGSTVTRQVSAMERDGLVHRKRDPSDGRGTLIAAAAAGRARLRRVRQARADLYRSVLAAWSAADRTTLATLLHRLNEDLDRHIHAGPPAPPGKAPAPLGKPASR
jgi:DNA-binding MarR family transcriptional regulator